jgi:VanZ family protein
MAAISAGSTDTLAAPETSWLIVPFLRWLLPEASPPTIDLLHTLIRKLGHFTEFGLLALLWYRTLAWGETAWNRGAAGRALAVSVVFAGIDETHQAFEAVRTGSLLDVGIDSLGALGALGIGRVISGRRGRNPAAPRRLVDRSTAMGSE